MSNMASKYALWAGIIIAVTLNTLDRFYAGEINKAAGRDLWPLAVRATDKNRNWLPGMIDTVSTEYGSSGFVRKTTELKMRIFCGVSNDLRSSIIKYIENDKDLTDKRKKAMLDLKKKDDNADLVVYMGFGALFPFFPEDQSITEHSNTGVSGILDGRRYSVYQYSRKQTNNSMQQGIAWLDTSTGIPILIKFTFKPLPTYVFSLTNEVYFVIGKNGVWYPDRIRLDGIGGFIFNKVHMITTTFFSDYWKSKIRDNR